MKEGWNVILRYDEAFARVNIWLVHIQGDQRAVVNPLDLTTTTQMGTGWLLPEPTMKISGAASHQFLQGFAEGLADAGFRPNELKAKDSQLEAVRAHLEDMRKLVFGALLPLGIPPQIPRK